RKVFEPANVFHARTFDGVERQITIIDRLRLTTRILFNITATNNPLAPQLRQSLANVVLKARIAPRAARVVNTNRRIRGHRAVEIARLALRYFAKRNPHAGQFAVDVNALRVWQRAVFTRISVGKFDSCAHKMNSPIGMDVVYNLGRW